MFLGYALAVLSILGTAKVAVALLVLGVPIIDTFWIIVRRLVTGSSPFKPDRGHIHHRLLDLGLSHRQAVLLIYAICAALGVLALVLSGTGQLYAFIGVGLGLGILALVLARREISEPTFSAESYPEDDRG
jgi:UDP-GlcNAc:undecaprenyl-phosphate GlcNAc-1-phosphate transferase